MTASIKTVIEAYGIGVRAGVITPQYQDEEHIRSLAALPAASPAVAAEWDSAPIRKPITLRAEHISDPQPQPGEENA